jgi:hypothetical protein
MSDLKAPTYEDRTHPDNATFGIGQHLATQLTIFLHSLYLQSMGLNLLGSFGALIKDWP